MNPHDMAVVGLALTSATTLTLAWLIGVQEVTWLITNYRRHPERYPDAKGLARAMGWTLAASGVSFGACALALAGGFVGDSAMGIWCGITGAATAAGALGNVARYRRLPPDVSQRRRGP